MATTDSVHHPAERIAPCLHFLSKGMFVSGQLEPTHELHGMGDGHCWCNLSQRALGPDQVLVSRTECRPGRACYQPRI